LRRPNAQCGFELVKAARACSRSMQNAPARCNRVNSEEAVRRCDDALAQRHRRTDPAIHRGWRLMMPRVLMLRRNTPREKFRKSASKRITAVDNAMTPA
jgi:hypothetical protein